ncbi:MAG: AraC family transcriptional regulator [Lentisphaerae bacterium]|nr:MAG: AraC family transcriptional regulator [Lentisphaerota bacterium]
MVNGMRPVLGWHLDLSSRPQIVAAGIGRHPPGVASFRVAAWSIHYYFYSARLDLDGVPIQLHPHSIGLTPPGVTGTYEFPPETLHYYIHFKTEHHESDNDSHDDEDESSRRFALNALTEPADEDARWFRREFERIIHHYAEVPDYADIVLWRLLMELALHYPLNFPVKEKKDHRVSRALKFIEMSLGLDVRVSDVSREVGLSSVHLNRLMKAELGLTCKQYILKRKLELARRLLLGTALPVKDVAQHCGFSNLILFNRRIRQAFGVSPRRFRKLIQSGDIHLLRPIQPLLLSENEK